MNNEEEFLLKWNNHQSNLIGVFKEWLRDESFVDVTLVCGGEAVSGHKVVLAACSPLLNRILHDNPCRHPVVILNDVCSADMKALLKFIYQGEVSVSQSELASFLRTADNLQIKGLAEDREKEDKKRKEKDDVPGGVRKKRKTDFRVSSQHPQIYNKTNQDSISSSPKSHKHFSSTRDKFSSFNSHQTPVGAVHSNSVNNQMVLSTEAIAHTLETEFEQTSEQQYIKEEELVVKTEPLDYTGEMVWQEGNSLIKRENASQDHCGSAASNASSSNSVNQHTYSGALPFGVLPSLENLGTGSTTDFLQKNLESIQSEEKRSEEDGKGMSVGNDELNQSNVVADEDAESSTETKNKGSDLKVQQEEDIQVICQPTTPSLASSSSSASVIHLPDDSRPNKDVSATFSVVTPFTSSSAAHAYCSMNGTLFSCGSCSFQSRNPYTFNRHLRIHYGTKEFKCSVCDYASTRKDSLNRHFRVKHFVADKTFLSAMRGTEEVAFHQI